jgi:hypothetical protein
VSQLPFVVYGRIKKDGVLQAGENVTVKNISKNQQYTIQTNSAGEYTIDLGDTTKFSNGYSNGDTVQVSSIGCSKQFTVDTSKWGEEVNISVWEISANINVNVAASMATATHYNIAKTVDIRLETGFQVEVIEVVTERIPGVDPDDVRDVLNLSASDVPDDKVYKMIKRAAVTVALELEKEIDYEECSDPEKEAITILAAIYAICYLTGGSAVGLSFSLGDKSVSVLKDAPPLNVLQAEFERLITRLKEQQKEEPYVGLA